MKKMKVIALSLFVSISVSVYADFASERNQTHCANFIQADTLNRIDADGLRQGLWILYGHDKNDLAFPADAKWKEGRYVDGKKEGKWIEYLPDGRIAGELNYHDGKPVK